MSRRLVLLAFLLIFIITALVSQITSSQSLANKQCLIPETGTVLDSNTSLNRALNETVHNLNTGLNYTTIQDAINAIETEDGHGILVDGNYTYYEHVVVNKSISVFGQDRRTTIIDGGGTGNVVNITKNNVNVTGFTIQNSGDYPYSGIYLTNVNHCNITENNVLSSGLGIHLYYSSNTTVCGNHIEANEKDGIELEESSNNTIYGNNITANNWYGIRLYSSSDNDIYGNSITDNYYGISLSSPSYNNTISGNNITNNYYGVRLYASSNNTISGNIVTANHQYGISLYASSYNTVSGNAVTANNWDGVRLYASSYNTVSGNIVTANHEFGIRLEWSSYNNTISGNNITNNWDGVHLYVSSNNTISGNTVSANHDDGIYLGGSHCNNVTENNITSHGVGIYLAGSSGNLIYHNNFVNNLDQVASYESANSWNDSYSSGGNYWSDYTDVDEKSGPNQDQQGSDGIWDHPYVIDENNIDHYPIVPEFPSFLILPLFMTITLLAVIVHRRKHTR